MLPLISVIIPVYNVEKFLDKCIDSILNQTYTNLEVILIDDGSTDSSPYMCDNYQERDMRVKVIHKENGGVSSARNAGLLIAKGEYITFVDSDDHLERTCLSVLYNGLIVNNCDIACSNLICETINGTQIYMLKYEESNKIFEINEYNMYNRSVYNKLFHRNCLQVHGNPLLFDEKLYYGEDALFTISAFVNARKIISLSNSLYHYVIHEDSAMQRFSVKSLTEVDAWDKIINLLKPFPKAQIEACAQYSLNAQRILINIFRNQRENVQLQKEMLSNVKKYKGEVFKSSAIPLKSKILYTIFSIYPKLYLYLLDTCKRVFKKKHRR